MKQFYRSLIPGLVLLFCLGVTTQAQHLDEHHPIHDMVVDQKAKGLTFDAVQLFDATAVDDVKNVRPDLEEAVDAGTVLQPDQTTINRILRKAPNVMTLQLPSIEKGIIELELVQVDIFADGFTVVESGTNRPVNVEFGVYYHGIVKGQPHSLAAISIHKGYVTGLVTSAQEGNLVLGKLDGANPTNQHILYNDNDLKGSPDFACGTPDDGIQYTAEQLNHSDHAKALSDCVQIYIEVEKDIHDDKGGTTGASNYMTDLFNQVFILYANESINMEISQIFVWTTTDPYTNGSSSGRLSQFQANTSSINGDLGHLVSYGASGGIAAGFSAICNTNVDNRLCFSSITGTYSNVPTYSWSVMVTTHEMGHLIGSRHTHACVWNGNNTAIDGCAGQTEGSCALPGYPSGGGTIMSYCHLQAVGINLSNGFGPQPGNVIRNSVTNGSCLNACGGGGGGGDCTTTISSFPYSEGFESGTGAWTQASGDDFDWSRRSGGTPSSNTGPSSAAQGTYYMYVEASSPNYPSRNTIFNGPCFDLSSVSDPEFSFQYHMLGNAVGVVNLQASTDGSSWSTVWTQSGTQGSNWNSATVDLGSYAGQSEVRLRFNATTGTSWQGDICIDDLSLINNTGGGGGGCQDTEVTVTINTDNYPGETTWEIRNSGGSVVASGGPYAASGTTYTSDVCLPDGCYDFIINDSYGDGICCAYGSGSYTVASASETYASGGSFGSSETTNFCVGGGGPPSCPAIDFNAETITAYGSGQNQGTASVQDGGATIFLQNNAWFDIAYNYTVTGSTVIEFDFRSTIQGEIHGIGFDTDEGISSNLTFKVHGTQNWGITNYDNYSGSSWTTYTIPVGSFYTGSFSKLFFVADHDGGARNGNSYFRNVKVYEGSCAGLTPAFTKDNSLSPQLGTEGEFIMDLMPNPASRSIQVNLDVLSENYIGRIVDATGKVVWADNLTNGQQTIDISRFADGLYYLNVISESGEAVTRKFVKAK